MLDPIRYSSKIQVNDIPPQWLSKIELYYPELPNFPVLYINKYVQTQRVYGFPVAIVSIEKNTNKLLNITFEVLSNVNLDENAVIKSEFKTDLEERIGVSDKISKENIEAICKGDNGYISFFKKLWSFIEEVYGKYIPYGKMYEEVYSIVRFVAAFQPKTGRQSEMRMLYNFMSIFGEKVDVSIDGDWSFCDFYLIPNYKDLKDKTFSDFPKFEKLFSAMEKVYNFSFTSSVDISEKPVVSIKCQETAFHKKKEMFIEQTLNQWLNNNKITKEDKFYIERLVDAFNRFPWRAAYFISSIFIAYKKSYESWDKAFFIDFYTRARKGISPKVIACFIQQGFGNSAVIPIDTWVKSFYNGALNIDDKITFFNTFDNIGKLERIIWLSSQANKTNVRTFFNSLWCCRYGTNGNQELRGQNPLACYECCLKDVCKGYQNIKDKNIYIIEPNRDLTNTDLAVLFNSLKENVLFVCAKENGVPKKVYKRASTKYYLTDEFSGYLLKDNKTPFNTMVVSVDDFLNSINPAYDTTHFNSLENSEL